VSFPGALLGMLGSASRKTSGAGKAAAPLGCFCLLLKENKTSDKRVAGCWGAPGWRGGWFWGAAAGGRASPLLPVIGFSFPSPRTKGPLRAVGKRLGARASSHRSPQLLKSHSSPARARGSGAGVRRAKAKETAGAGGDVGGPPGGAPSPARGWPWGPPSPSPGLQPHLCRCRPASIPVGNAPVVSRGAARPGSCPRPRSCPFPRGGHKGAIFAGLAELQPLPPATGQRDSPQPRCPPVPLSPAALGTPHSATSPAQGPGAVPASLWLRAAKPRGTPLPKKRDGAGERDQHRFSQLYPRTCVVAGRERG